LGLLTVRVLRPPVALEVLVAGASEPEAGVAGAADEVAEPPAPHYGAARPGGPGESAAGRDDEPVPRRLLQIRSLDAAARPRIDGRVRVAAGPWRLEEGWWSEDPADRDYWDVELSGGGLYRVFRDRRSGEWWADGVYD
jgi:hypothetical protein